MHKIIRLSSTATCYAASKTSSEITFVVHSHHPNDDGTSEKIRGLTIDRDLLNDLNAVFNMEGVNGEELVGNLDETYNFGLSQFNHLPYDKFPLYIRQEFYEIEAKAVPLTENQEGYFPVLDELAQKWEVKEDLMTPQKPKTLVCPGAPLACRKRLKFHTGGSDGEDETDDNKENKSPKIDTLQTTLAF